MSKIINRLLRKYVKLDELSLDDLRELNRQVVNAINTRIEVEGEAAAEELSIGAKVWFTHKATKLHGTITGMGTKFAKVEVEEERPDHRLALRAWSVPPALLHIAEPAQKAGRKLKRKRLPRVVHDEGEL